MRLPQLSTNEIYHVYNRGVDKRDLFNQEKDYLRFIRCFSLFKNPFVNILAFCLMPNHFHLLLEQCVEDGITKFLHKLCTSHAMYFNLSYDRNGALFEPKFKAKHIHNESYYSQISKYIHLNPLDLFIGLSCRNKYDLLLNYPWSSLPAYLGQKHPDFLDTRIIDEFQGPEDYLAFLKA